MELTNEFTVGVPIEQAWAVLTDLERIAPCMPGAQLQEVEGEEFRGTVKVKVGPITAQYKGAASFQELDQGGGRAVLRAEGRDTRGQGNASATITATLEPEGDGTSVTVVTDLTVTGKVAQFGRGVLGDVSAKLMQQFVECLERDVLAGAPERTEPEVPVAESAPVGGAGVVATPTGGGMADAAPSVGDITDEVPVVTEEAWASYAPDRGADAGAPVVDLAAAGSPATAPRRIDAPEATPVDLLGTAGTPVARRVGPVVGVVVVVLWLLRRRRRRSASRR